MPTVRRARAMSGRMRGAKCFCEVDLRETHICRRSRPGFGAPGLRFDEEGFGTAVNDKKQRRRQKEMAKRQTQKWKMAGR